MCLHRGSNPGSSVYETDALPLGHRGYGCRDHWFKENLSWSNRRSMRIQVCPIRVCSTHIFESLNSITTHLLFLRNNLFAGFLWKAKSILFILSCIEFYLKLIPFYQNWYHVWGSNQRGNMYFRYVDLKSNTLTTWPPSLYIKEAVGHSS